MNIYALVDNREIDALDTMILFKNKEDAESMQRSIGRDAQHYSVHEFEVIF